MKVIDPFVVKFQDNFIKKLNSSSGDAGGSYNDDSINCNKLL